MTESRSPTPIAIIAGQGAFPTVLFSECNRARWKPYLIALTGITDGELAIQAKCSIRIGEFGKLRAFLKAHDISNIVFAGKVQRPKVWQLRPDILGIKVLISGLKALTQKDNAALETLEMMLEKNLDVTLRAPSDVAPSLVVNEGHSGAPPKQAILTEHLISALNAARDLGTKDKGQSILWQNGKVLHEEGAQGTTAMIKAYNSITNDHGDAVIFAKAAKPQQKLENDMPAFGVETLHALYNAGVFYVVLEAKKVIMTNPWREIDTCAKACNITIWAISTPYQGKEGSQ